MRNGDSNIGATGVTLVIPVWPLTTAFWRAVVTDVFGNNTFALDTYGWWMFTVYTNQFVFGLKYIIRLYNQPQFSETPSVGFYVNKLCQTRVLIDSPKTQRLRRPTSRKRRHENVTWLALWKVVKGLTAAAGEMRDTELKSCTERTEAYIQRHKGVVI